MIGKPTRFILLAVFLSSLVCPANAGWWNDWRKKQYEGYTTFHEAAKAGDVEQLRVDLEKGADINQRSRSAKCTAVGCAVRWRQYDAAKFLLEQGADPSIPYLFAGKRRTPLQAAAQLGRMDYVRLLMRYVGSPDEGMDVLYPNCHCSAFTWACSEGHLDVAQYLLDQGADINIRNSGHAGPPLIASVRQLRLESVCFLLENGADITVKDQMRARTPLEWGESILRSRHNSIRSILEGQQHIVSEQQLQEGRNTCSKIIVLLKQAGTGE